MNEQQGHAIPEKGTVRRERLIALAFLGIIVAYVLQTLFIHRYGEPYPALVLPTFAGTGSNRAGQVSAEFSRIRVVFADGGVEDVSPAYVFSELPEVFIMRLAFKPRPPAPPPTGDSPVRRFVARVLPGYAHTLARRERWSGVDERSRVWLRRRVTVLFPERRPIQATIVWHRDLYSFSDRGVHRDQDETNRLDIEL